MKYKLIKLYPNSPEIGTIVQKVKSGNGYGWNNEGPYDSRLFTNKTVEHYPEFWEEVKEKEYTILSFVNNSGDLFHISSDGGYRFKTWEKSSLSLERCLSGSLKIHSVRRESDGEVFTLGDLVSDSCVKPQVLKKIEIYKDVFLIEAGVLGCKLDFIKKESPIRKPILVTEDGVEVFEGENPQLFSVCTKANWMESRTPCTRVSEWSKDWKHFHTKEAREEYIKWNKPMYSLNDINKANNKSLMENKDLIKVIQELDRK